MRNARSIVLMTLIMAAGAGVMARVDWLRESRAQMAETVRSGERLAGVLSLYPMQAGSASIRNLLAKTLVEQSSGDGVAYLLVYDMDGKPLLTVGDLTLRIPADVSTESLATAGPLRQRFKARDQAGDILEFAKPLIQPGGQAGTVRLGLRVPAVPLVSAARLSSLAAVVFLMTAALVVGYYALQLAIRRLGNARANGDGSLDALAATRANGNVNVFSVMEHLDISLSEARAELRKSGERIAELSSNLGVAAFEKEQAYRVLDGLDFGTMILDARERICHLNRQMLELAGVRREDVRGKTCGEAIRHEPLCALVENRTPGAGGGASMIDAEFPETAPGRFFRIACRPMPDSRGESIGTLVTVEDITRARLADKAQEDFVAQVAHELFTPLTSMKAHAEMLMLGDVSAPEMLKEYYNTINDEVDRLTALIKNLLSVSKIETGGMTIERSVVRTDWLLDQCLPAINASARAKRITVSKQLADKFPAILGDKELLKVLLINVLGNAVKYTPEGGAVQVSLLEQDHSVFFAVSDTGCGIPQEDLPKVFDKFFRGGAVAVRNQSGSGLGLATALQIARLHGGGIDVTSEPGKGSCFTVRIPVEAFTLEKP